MAKAKESGWTIRAIGVSFVNGERQERPLEDFTKAELQEIAKRKNLEALAAAGYVPVAKQAAEILLVNVSTVYELMNKGDLPYLILGKGNGSRKVRGSDLERFIESQEPEQPNN